MISKQASTIAYILAAIGFFDFSLTESGRAGQNELQLPYKGEYAELYQSDYSLFISLLETIFYFFIKR